MVNRLMNLAPSPGALMAVLLCLLAAAPPAARADDWPAPGVRAFVDLVNTYGGRLFCPPRGTTLQSLDQAVTAFSMVHPELGDRLNNEQKLRALALRHPCDPSQVAPRGPDARLRRAFRDGEAPLVLARPVFGQLLWMSLPAGFQAVPVREQTQDGAHFLSELVPEGETAASWTEKITVSADKGLARAQRDLTARTYLAAAVADWKSACPESFVGSAMPTDPVSGFEAYAAIVSCGTAPGGNGDSSESALLLAIRGAQDFYRLQWSERGPAWSTPLTIDSQHWIDKLLRLVPLKLCPLVAGEGPPYPGCIARP